MSFRVFTDRDGNRWYVRPRGRTAWEFEPARGNPGSSPRRVRPPGYESDPFELSERELQRLFDAAAPAKGPSRPSPFLDD